MPDVTGTFDEVKGHDSSNIHKVLRMSVFVGLYGVAPAISTIVDATNELVIPDTYESLGIMDKENPFTDTPALTSSEVGGYGYAQPVRRDQVSRVSALAFTMLESKRRNFEMYYGVDLSAVQATAAGGKNEFTFDEPDRPDTQYYRVLCIGVDGDGVDTIYIADHYPKCTITDVAAIAASETDPRRYGVTMGADVDTVVGTAHRPFWAGPGLTSAKLTAMGITRAGA